VKRIDSWVLHHMYYPGGEFLWRSHYDLTPATKALIAAAVLADATKGSPE
jgi:hypothetical protein